MKYGRFESQQGDAIKFTRVAGDTRGIAAYLVAPHAPKTSAPAFSLILDGKLVARLYGTPYDGIFMGRRKGGSILLFKSAKSFEVFTFDLKPVELLDQFSSGSLTDEIGDVRAKMNLKEYK